MKTYKDRNNQLHCIDPLFEHFLPAGCIEITDEEAEAIRIANTPDPVEVPQIDPVEKLKAFLAQNPDVASILDKSSI